MTTRFPQVRRLDSVAKLRARLTELELDIPVDETFDPEGVLASPNTITDGSAGSLVAPNRFAVLPMEGWDGTRAGAPTDLVRRRWSRFAASGCGLVWGEATAVRADGRANPRQLVLDATTVDQIAALRGLLDPAQVAGLQLTHSGRWSRPEGPPTPRTAYRHPLLDGRVGATDASVLRDDELEDLAATYVDAAVLARDAGFAFVDIKHCHGYLLHELLSARFRPGAFGGDLAGRTRFLRTVVRGVRDRAPDLAVAIRLSAFDLVPFVGGADGRGEPEARGTYPYAFGGDGTGLGIDLTETHAFLDELVALGIGLVSITAGSPYYNPHVQRPAYFPPSDGYDPPEDPLVGVAAPALGDGRAHARASRADHRRIRVLLPPGLAAERRARGARARRHHDGRPRPDDPVVPLAPRRRARGPRSGPAHDLPHVLGLHHRAPRRARVRLLPARSLLQGASRPGRALEGQADRPAWHRGRRALIRDRSGTVAVLARVLLPLPDRDFDVTEVAVPWFLLREAGHEIVFVTEHGATAAADPRLLTGVLFGQLGAAPEPRRHYAAMTTSSDFRSPGSWLEIDVASFDALLLPGGHAPGMRQYLGSAALHQRVAAFWALGRPVGAICHGVLVLARSRDLATGHSVLHDARTTCLPKYMERSAYLATGWKLGRYYRTYPAYVEDEVSSALADPATQFRRGPRTLTRRGTETDDAGTFVVEDGRYVSARWPGDAYAFARSFLRRLT